MISFSLVKNQNSCRNDANFMQKVCEFDEGIVHYGIVIKYKTGSVRNKVQAIK